MFLPPRVGTADNISTSPQIHRVQKLHLSVDRRLLVASLQVALPQLP